MTGSARRHRAGDVVGSADAFFVHVEDSGAPQITGVIAVLRPTRHQPSLSEVRRLVRDELAHLPGFTSRLASGSAYRRPRWVEAGVPDLDWHVVERSASDRRAMEAIVAGLAEQPFPRDRPLWRVIMVRDLDRGRSAMVFAVHHALGDASVTVTDALQVMRPRSALPARRSHAPTTGRIRRAGATALGIGHLAADVWPLGRPGAGSGRRTFATARLGLADVLRSADVRGVRVTDLELALVGDAVASTCPWLSRRLGGRLRVAVPRLVGGPPEATKGLSRNATGAVMFDVPVDGRPIEELLQEVARRTRRLGLSNRAMAARFVMTAGLRAVPEPAAGWFARTVYGQACFQGIITNIPGPTGQLSLGEVPVDVVYPIAPLAPGAPFALGTLSWHGVLGIGLTTDPELVDAHVLLAHLADTAAGLARAAA